MSVQLAYYEANAAALAGDTSRAKNALTRAETIADARPGADTGTSPWSFSPERQAMFALSVALRTGDADGALRAALAADQGWAARRSVHPRDLGAGTDRRSHRAPAQGLTRRSSRAGSARACDAPRVPHRHRHRLACRP